MRIIRVLFGFALSPAWRPRLRSVLFVYTPVELASCPTWAATA